MVKYYIAGMMLVGFCVLSSQAQVTTICNKSFFYEIIGGGKDAKVNIYRFNQTYTLSGSDNYQRLDDHLKFVPGDSDRLLREYVDTSFHMNINMTRVSDFRTEKRYSNNGIWYSLDPDDPENKRSARVRRTGHARLALSTVAVTAKHRFPIEQDSIPGTWEIKFSPGFAFTYQAIAWDRIRNANKVFTSGIELGIVANISTSDINDKTTGGEYKLSRSALTFNTGVLVNLSLGNLDIGLFGGLDIATGDGADVWIYQAQPNWGFILGIDLINAKS